MNPNLEKRIIELETRVAQLNNFSTLPNEMEFALRERLQFKFIPTISSGFGAPTSIPTKIGDIYIDMTNSKFYGAIGTTASTSWKFLFNFTQQSAITKPTGGATVDTQARTAIGTIIDTLQTLTLTA